MNKAIPGKVSSGFRPELRKDKLLKRFSER
jgi:hypothetical protein